ncbi:MAG: hypothetical protein II970_00665 [Paludibacteraceae bacterium]|nr:hypothetical protein [Paludibacteraceae bacterium]
MNGKTVYDLVAELIAAGQWDYLRAASDWAETKHCQFLVYRHILQHEPDRSYGYIQRTCSSKSLITSLIGGVLRH